MAALGQAATATPRSLVAAGLEEPSPSPQVALRLVRASSLLSAVPAARRRADRSPEEKAATAGPWPIPATELLRSASRQIVSTFPAGTPVRRSALSRAAAVTAAISWYP